MCWLFPESKREAGSVAHDIARPYLKAGVEVLTLTFPMIRDAEANTKNSSWECPAHYRKIDAGLNVAFLTLGDPMLYSTYIYLLDNMKDQGIDIVSIPGIYSFSAISNLLNEPLVKGDESMAVISEFNLEAWEKLQSVQTIVCMKVSALWRQLFEALQSVPDRKMVMVPMPEKKTQTVSYKVEDSKGISLILQQ